jgi:hypothetical protein
MGLVEGDGHPDARLKEAPMPFLGDETFRDFMGGQRTNDKNDVTQQDDRTGRWYIKMGFAGFNSKANNYSGYATQDDAVRAILRYQNKVA